MGWFLLRKPNPGFNQEDRINISNDEILVGRGRDCAVHCFSLFVSRHHLRLILKDDRDLYVKDLGSSNGTFVNSNRIPSGTEMPLQLGDEVGIGNTLNTDKNCFIYVVHREECDDVMEGFPLKEEPQEDVQPGVESCPVLQEGAIESPRALKRCTEPEVVTLLDDDEDVPMAKKCRREEEILACQNERKDTVNDSGLLQPSDFLPNPEGAVNNFSSEDKTSSKTVIQHTSKSEVAASLHPSVHSAGNNSSCSKSDLKSEPVVDVKQNIPRDDTVPPCQDQKPLNCFDKLAFKPVNQRLSTLMGESSTLKASCGDLGNSNSSLVTLKLGSSVSSSCSTPLKKTDSLTEAKPLWTSTPCHSHIKVEDNDSPASPALSESNWSPICKDSSRLSQASSANYTLDEEIIPISDDDDDDFPCSQMFCEDVKPDKKVLDKDISVVVLSDEEEPPRDELEDLVILSSDEDGDDLNDYNRWIERLSQSTTVKTEKKDDKEKDENCLSDNASDMWDQEFEDELQDVLDTRDKKLKEQAKQRESLREDESSKVLRDEKKSSFLKEAKKKELPKLKEKEKDRSKLKAGDKQCAKEEAKSHHTKKDRKEEEKLHEPLPEQPVSESDSKSSHSKEEKVRKHRKDRTGSPKKKKLHDRPVEKSSTRTEIKSHKPHTDNRMRKSHEDARKASSKRNDGDHWKRLRNIFSAESSDEDDNASVEKPQTSSKAPPRKQDAFDALLHGDSDFEDGETSSKAHQPHQDAVKAVKPVSVTLQRIDENVRICERYGLPSTPSPPPKKDRRKIQMTDALPNPPRKASNRGISGPTAVKLFDSSREDRDDREGRRRSLDGKDKDPKAIRKEKLAEVAARRTSGGADGTSGRRAPPPPPPAAGVKVKVTQSNRGSFLVSGDEPRAAKKPRSRKEVVVKKIPKLADASKANHHPYKSPLQALNMSYERVPPAGPAATTDTEGPRAPPAKPPPAKATPKAAPLEIPTGPQPKRRIAQVPPPGFHDHGEAPSPQLQAASTVPVSSIKSCLSGSSKHNISLNASKTKVPPKKSVKFKENLVEYRYIDKLPGTRPLGTSKDSSVPIPLSLSKVPQAPTILNNDCIIEDVIYDITKWNPIWLKEEKNLPPDVLPPVVPNMNLPAVPRTEFLDFKEYHDTWYPLLMLNLWASLSKDYDKASKDSRLFMAIDSATSARVASRPDKMLMTLNCHMLLGRQFCDHPKLGNLVIADIAMKDASGTLSVMPVFAYCTFSSKDVLRHHDQFHKGLIPYCRDPMFKLRFSLVTRERKNCTLYLERPMLIKNVTYLRGDLRVFLAMRNLEHMGLLYSVISPSAANEDFTLPDVRTKRLALTNNKECLNPSQMQIVLQTAEVCLQDRPKICLIQGPPGTGKTETIINLVQQLLYRDNMYTRNNREKGLVPRILLCAPSNAAIDVLVRRLLRKRELLEKQSRFKMVRVGLNSIMHPDVKEISLEELADRDWKAKNQDLVPENIQTQLRTWEAKLKGVENAIQSLASSNKIIPEELVYRQADLARGLRVLEERWKQSQHSKPHQRPSNQTFAMQRETMKKILRGADIVATTLTSCLINVMETVFPPSKQQNKYHFGACIVDEATQCLELETLIPLMLGVKTLVLVGDSNQLPATIISKVAKEKGLGTSLFARLQKVVPDAVQMLNVQYRMHPAIVEWPNHFFYSGRLKTPDEILSRRTSSILPYAVLSLPFKQDPAREMNVEEAEFVLQLADLMIERKAVSTHEFRLGIISPYQNQRRALLDRLGKKNTIPPNRIEINTIDSYQGQEKDIIIISCVRTSGVGFLADRQRLNVALTRAKYALLICGNFSSLDRDPMWNHLLSDARKRKCFLNFDPNFNFQNRDHLWNVLSKKLQR